jgi:hypothetical protein
VDQQAMAEYRYRAVRELHVGASPRPGHQLAAADSWHIGAPAALYSTCSPHRVALTVLHIRNYYQDDFASRLVGTLPDWTTGSANAMAPHPSWLTAASRTPLGKPHDDVGSDDTHPNYLARVLE